MCHADCICEGWKAANCGGDFSGDPKNCKHDEESNSVLDVAVEANGSFAESERAFVAMRNARRARSSVDGGLDTTLTDKCVG